MTVSFLTLAERHARFWDVVKKIGAGLAFVGAAIAAVVWWVKSRPSADDLAASEGRVIAVVNTQGDAMRAMNDRIIVLEVEFAESRRENDRNWNGLDRVLQKQFGQSILTTPPPTYGTEARQQGRR